MPPPAAVCSRKLVAGIRIRIFLGQQIQKKLSKLKPKSWLEGTQARFQLHLENTESVCSISQSRRIHGQFVSSTSVWNCAQTFACVEPVASLYISREIG
jgi:hypothetical protein